MIKQPKIPFTNLGSEVRAMLQASQSNSTCKAFHLSHSEFACVLLPADIKQLYDIVLTTFIFLYDFVSKKMWIWEDQPVLKNIF